MQVRLVKEPSPQLRPASSTASSIVMTHQYERSVVAICALACAALTCVVPSLNPIHTLPIPSFYEEWIAAALALITFAVVLWSARGEAVRFAQGMVPLVAFAALLLVQISMSRLAYAEQGALALLYVLLAIAMVWSGMQLRQTLGLERVARTIATALLIGGVLNALISFVQAYAPVTPLDALIARPVSARVFGNLGQPNLLADQLALAGVSLLYLWITGALRAGLALPLGVVLIGALSLAGSRSAWLYGGALLGWTLTSLLQRADANFGRLALALIAALGVLALAPALLPSVNFASASQLPSSAFERLAAMRLDTATAGEALRGYFWHHAWNVAQQAPLLGAGIGQFATSFVQWPPEGTDALAHPVERNAHNLWLHLLAETGIVGALCIGTAIALWACRVLRAPADPTRWWLVSTVGVVLIHSQLEYPLWHAHFLVPFALLIGLAESRPITARPGVTSLADFSSAARVAALALLATGAVMLALLLHGYHELRQWVYLANEANLQDAAFLARQREAIRRVRASLLAPYVDLPLAGTQAVNAESLADKLALNERALRFAPIPPLMLRQVVFLTLAGRHGEAQRLYEIAARFYPRELPAFAADVDRLRARGLAIDALATYVASRTGNN